MFYIFVFRARGSAYKFFERLKREGVPSTIISTPFLTNGGCSLSVRVSAEFFERANRLLMISKPQFFVGTYYTLSESGKIAYRKM